MCPGTGTRVASLGTENKSCGHLHLSEATSCEHHSGFALERSGLVPLKINLLCSPISWKEAVVVVQLLEEAFLLPGKF